MSRVNHWLLPDGIEEFLPEQAQVTDHLRRKLVDLFQCWGYDYVIPPMVEFTDSLLTGSGLDVDLMTFKVTDQLSGKMMGIRADITPQVARMDAHSLEREGVNRLCYAGHVMHTRQKGPLASRTPLKVGVELFGESGLDADIEVVSLLVEALDALKIEPYLDLGHVGVFRALSEFAQLDNDEEAELFQLLQSKSGDAIAVWVKANLDDEEVQQWFLSLVGLSGGMSMFAKAREQFDRAPAEVLAAIDELEDVASVLVSRYPNANLYFDLSELRGYHYHTGLVFGAYTQGAGTAIASGGRYDHVGEVFGRSRAATGFDIDLSSVCRVIQTAEQSDNGIFVADVDQQGAWQAVQALRQQGQRVVVGLSGQAAPESYQRCNQLLTLIDGQWQVSAIS